MKQNWSGRDGCTDQFEDHCSYIARVIGEPTAWCRTGRTDQSRLGQSRISHPLIVCWYRVNIEVGPAATAISIIMLSSRNTLDLPAGLFTTSGRQWMNTGTVGRQDG
jgi:hypothetical protein